MASRLEQGVFRIGAGRKARDRVAQQGLLDYLRGFGDGDFRNTFSSIGDAALERVNGRRVLLALAERLLADHRQAFGEFPFQLGHIGGVGELFNALLHLAQLIDGGLASGGDTGHGGGEHAHHGGEFAALDVEEPVGVMAVILKRPGGFAGHEQDFGCLGVFSYPLLELHDGTLETLHFGLFAADNMQAHGPQQQLAELQQRAGQFRGGTLNVLQQRLEHLLSTSFLSEAYRRG